MTMTTAVGERIAEARKKRNMLQTDLAKKLSISPQAIGKWERGESMPDIITFHNLAKALDVDMNYFVGESRITEGQTAEAAEQDKLGGQTAEAAGQDKLRFDMSWANWKDADFSGLKGLGVRFAGSNIERCIFKNSDLSGLSLKGNNMLKSDFAGADLSGSRIAGSNIVGCGFAGANLSGSKIKSSNIGKCDFAGADFTKSAFSSSNLSSAVSGVKWEDAVFKASGLSNMEFDSGIAGCQFIGCRFSKITFKGVAFKNCFFKNNTGMKKVKFVDCSADKLTLAFLKSEKADTDGITLTH